MPRERNGARGITSHGGTQVVDKLFDERIKVAHVFIALLGIVFTALVTLCGLAWNASATLQQIKDSQTHMEYQIQQQETDMQAVKAILWTPTLTAGKKR